MTRIRINFKTEPAKDFEVKPWTGYASLDLRGKTVIIGFWATWCVPCREEMPLLVELCKITRVAGLGSSPSSDVPEGVEGRHVRQGIQTHVPVAVIRRSRAAGSISARHQL